MGLLLPALRVICSLWLSFVLYDYEKLLGPDSRGFLEMSDDDSKPTKFTFWLLAIFDPLWFSSTVAIARIDLWNIGEDRDLMNSSPGRIWFNWYYVSMYRCSNNKS